VLLAASHSRTGTGPRRLEIVLSLSSAPSCLLVRHPCSYPLKHLLIHYIDESVLSWDGDGHELPDPEEDRALEAWDAEMIARGILTGGGALRPVAQTKTLRVRGGEFMVTDGPFAETKEQIAGYSVLECSSLDEAIEVCSRHPTAKIGRFELRPFQAEEEAGEEVIPTDPPGGEKQALLHFLDYQRASVLSTVAGLDEEAWHRPVVPSGWTPAGLVEHLGDAERHWFQRVITGSETDLPWTKAGRPTTRRRHSCATARRRT